MTILCCFFRRISDLNSGYKSIDCSCYVHRLLVTILSFFFCLINALARIVAS